MIDDGVSHFVGSRAANQPRGHLQFAQVAFGVVSTGADAPVAQVVAHHGAHGLLDVRRQVGEVIRAAPEVDHLAAAAVSHNRHRGAVLERVRESYRRQAAQPGWVRVDGERERPAVAADVATAVARLLERR